MLSGLKVGDKFVIKSLDGQGFADMITELNSLSIDVWRDHRVFTETYLGKMGTVIKIQPYEGEEWVFSDVEIADFGIIKMMSIFFDEDSIRTLEFEKLEG